MNRINILKKLLILIILTTSFNLNANNSTKIIFSIEKKIYTNLDLENRINYVKLKNKKIKNINIDEIKKDYISSLIFYKFSKERVVIKDILLNEFYNNFFKVYENTDNNEFKVIFDNLDKKIIYKNLLLDISRKIILEDLLSKKKDFKINREININDIYDVSIEYFSLNNENYKIFKERKINLNFDNLEKNKTILKKNNISYLFQRKNILNIDKINLDFKKIISKSKNNFKIVNSDHILIGKVVKKIKFENKITLNLIELKILNSNLNIDKINCNNYNNISGIKFKKLDDIKYSNLNNEIKEKIKKINDKIFINANNDKKRLILLCEINYEKDFFKNYKINTQVDSMVNKIESEFINKYKKIYNLNEYE